MLDLCGRVIEFYDGDKLRPALVTQQIGPKLQTVDAKGKKQKIRPKQVAVVHAPCDPSTLGATIRTLMTDMTAISNEIDLGLVWETTLESDACEWTAKTLADEYFGQASSLQVSAMLRALLRQSGYFKRRTLTFTPQSRQAVEQQQQVERKRAAQAAWEAAALHWMRTSLNSGRCPALPDEIQALPGKLGSLLWQEQTELEPLLKKAAGQKAPREAAYELLDALGKLPPGTDRYLALAGIRQTFSAEVMAEIETLPTPSTAGREDLRHLYLLAIDDPETRDIDDAIGIEATATGWRIYIAIADLTELIAPGSPLDEIAHDRHTSIYLPSQTAHMLPTKLGCDHASLYAGVDRAAALYQIDINPDGTVTDYAIHAALIQVSRQVTYDELAAFVGTESDDQLTITCNTLAAAANALRKKRLADGALIVQRPELKFDVRSESDLSVRVLAADSPSRDLVGEYMILANRISADYGSKTQTPLIFRAQNPAHGVPRGTVLEYDPVHVPALLRGMNRTFLSVSPRPHASLGLPAYSQATSPIRRYADMLVQRQILARVRGNQLPHNAEELMSFIAGAEQVEPDFKSLEGQSKRFWQIQYLAVNHADKRLTGLILYDVKGGYLVELCDFPIRGLLVTGESFSPGARVSVKIHRANAKRQELKFTL